MCARLQGRLWQYHETLFAHQRGRNQGAFSPRNLKSWARELGLDGDRFDRCLDSGETLPTVQRHFQEGEARGVNATPTLFIDGRKVEGLVPWDQLKPMVEEALRRKGLQP